MWFEKEKGVQGFGEFWLAKEISLMLVGWGVKYFWFGVRVVGIWMGIIGFGFGGTFGSIYGRGIVNQSWDSDKRREVFPKLPLFGLWELSARMSMKEVFVVFDGLVWGGRWTRCEGIYLAAGGIWIMVGIDSAEGSLVCAICAE